MNIYEKIALLELAESERLQIKFHNGFDVNYNDDEVSIEDIGNINRTTMLKENDEYLLVPSSRELLSVKFNTFEEMLKYLENLIKEKNAPSNKQ